MSESPEGLPETQVRHRTYMDSDKSSVRSGVISCSSPDAKEKASAPPPSYSSLSSMHSSPSASCTSASLPIGDTTSCSISQPETNNSGLSSNPNLTGVERTSVRSASSNASTTVPSSQDTETSRDANASNTTGTFECNICLDPAKDAVVSLCGHLFCWPCLHQWLETTTQARAICPVCKAAINRNKVIPIYGRGGDCTQDPRSKIPPRPAGRRQEPEPTWIGFGAGLSSLFGAGGGGFGGTRGGGNGNGGVLRMSVGIGSFPFGLFATTFNFGSFGSGSSSVGFAGSGNGGAAGGQATNGYGGYDHSGDGSLVNNTDAERMSQLCIVLAVVFLIWLLF